MERYRCCNCGKVFPCEEAGFQRVYVGEFWGTPAYEMTDVCPDCDSDELEEYEGDEEEEE